MVLANSESENALLEWIESFGGSPWLLAIVMVVTTLFSEDLTCISGGVLAAKEMIPFWGATAACAFGIWVGDLGLYGLGCLAGRTKHWKWVDRIVTPERVARGRHLFEVYGVRWIFLSRFLPGTRLPSYVAAGAVGWSFRRFAFALAIAAVIWTPILCGLAFFAGRAVLEWVDSYQKWAWPVLIGAVILIWLIVRNVLPLFSWRGRRLLRARWTRLRRWEFWPIWALYPPIVLCLLWQAIRLRGALLFTCCDPAIPHSGFAMESKGDILDALHCPDESRIRIANYRRLPAGEEGEERAIRVAEFLTEHGLAYPVVLKPDVGERGQGVAIVRDEEEARRWLDRCAEEALVQEFIGGVEFGVQWYRAPDEEVGTVPSIAGKETQYVIGDGQRTLEHLILDDARAVTMAHYFLAKFEPRLDEIPAENERVDLTEIGTHARGAVFTDERQYISDELRSVLDVLGDHYEGFHFGRYDVLVPSVADLQAGRNLVIVELNGVTGEPIHVYQPGFSWWRGIGDLCRHWKRACELGAANRARGAKPSSLGEFWRVVRAHRKQSWFEADELLAKGGDE